MSKKQCAYLNKKYITAKKKKCYHLSLSGKD